jgi:lipoate-protein ligase A
VEKLTRHGVASVRQRVTNLSGHLDASAVGSIEELEEHLIRYFTDGELELTSEQVSEIEEMAKEYKLHI